VDFKGGLNGGLDANINLDPSAHLSGGGQASVQLGGNPNLSFGADIDGSVNGQQTGVNFAGKVGGPYEDGMAYAFNN